MPQAKQQPKQQPKYAYEEVSKGAFIRRPFPADGKLPQGWVTELPFKLDDLMKQAQAKK